MSGRTRAHRNDLLRHMKGQADFGIKPVGISERNTICGLDNTSCASTVSTFGRGQTMTHSTGSQSFCHRRCTRPRSTRRCSTRLRLGSRCPCNTRLGSTSPDSSFQHLRGLCGSMKLVIASQTTTPPSVDMLASLTSCWALPAVNTIQQAVQAYCQDPFIISCLQCVPQAVLTRSDAVHERLQPPWSPKPTAAGCNVDNPTGLLQARVAADVSLDLHQGRQRFSQQALKASAA